MADSGFVSVPVMPVFAGMSKEFSDKLIKPAQKAGKQAGDAISKPMDSAVTSLEKQVSASQSKLTKLDQAYEKSASKREQQQDKLEAATLRLEDAENKYKDAIAKGDSGLKELARVKDEKAKVTKATDDLRQAEIDVVAAEEKHKDQLDDLTRTMGKLDDARQDMTDGLGESGGVFDGLNDKVGGLGDSLSDMPGPIGNVGDMLSNFKLGPAAGVAAVTTAVGGAAGAFMKWNEDLTQDRISMQNQFGLTAEAAADMQGEVADALSHGFGMEATSEAIQSITQVWGDEIAHMGGQTAAQLSDDFMAFNQTFQRSADETASAVDVLLNSGMVDSAQEGLDLLTAGMQQVPAAMQDEVFDALNEYSKNFSNLGISGEQAMSMLVDASENGQYAIDKTGDAIKEFSVLAIDPAKAEAFEAIGLNAEDMATAVAGGGDSAAQALRDAAQGLLDIEDPGKRAATAVELFGAPIEDLGVDQIPAFLESLTAGGDGMGDFAGSAQTMADNTQSTFTGMVDSWKGSIQGWAIDATLALNEWGGEALSWMGDQGQKLGAKIGEWSTPFTSAWDEITAAFDGGDWGYGALADLIGATNAEWAINKVSSVLPAWDEITAAFGGGDWGYGALSDLVGAENAEWVIGKISSIIPAFDEVWAAFQGIDWGSAGLTDLIGEEAASWVLDTIDRLRESIVGLKDSAVAAFDEAKKLIGPILEWLNDFLDKQMGETLASLGGALGSVMESFGGIAAAAGGVLWDALTAIFDVLLELWDLVSPLLVPILKTLAGILGGVLAGGFMTAVGAVRLAAEIFEVLAGIVLWVTDSVLVPLIGVVGDLIQWFSGHLVDSLQTLGDFFASIFGAISSIWDGFTDLLFVGFEFITATVFGGLGAGLETLQDNFGIAVEAIRKIWDGLKEAAAAPVRFIVDTVWNNGLLKAIGAVTRFIPGLEAPDPVQIGFARGGILPGWSSMADGDSRLVPMRDGEGVLVSEGLRDERSRELFLSANEAAKSGMSFADFMGHAGDSYRAGGYATGGIVNLAGALSGIQASHAQFVGRFFPDMFALTSASRNEPGSMHDYSMAAATDWQAQDGQYASQMPTPWSKALANAIYVNFPNTQQLIHHPLDGWQNLLGGGPHNYGAATNAQHGNHVHWGTNSALRFDGDDIILDDIPGGGGNGGGNFVKRAWDAVVNAINPFPDEGNGSWFSEIPGAFLKGAAESLWEFISSKVTNIFSGGSGGGAEQWRDLASQALSIWGYGDEYLDAMVRQIEIESGGDPNAINLWDSNAVAGTPSAGLLQVIEPTYQDVRRRYPERFEGLPDDRTHPLTNLVAGIGALERDWGGPPGGRWPTKDGYAMGGIIDLPAGIYDRGGILPAGGVAFNMSGLDEVIVNNPDLQALNALSHNVAALVQQLARSGDVDAFVSGMSAEFGPHIERVEAQLALLADPYSDEGIVARQATRRVLDLGIDLPGADVIVGVLDAEESIWAAREQQLGHLDNIAEKEQALADARQALEDLETTESGLTVQEQRKLTDAETALEEARALTVDTTAKAEKQEEQRAKNLEKVTDAEEKLRRVQEDLDISAAESAEKRAEEITQANDAVLQAELALGEARKQQVADLGSVIVLSQGQIAGLADQAAGFASQLVGMGVHAGMVSQGLGAVSGALGAVSAMAGPAGVSLGLALSVAEAVIGIVQQIDQFVRELIQAVWDARIEARQTMADAWSTISDYVSLNVQMSQNVASLQQQIVRGMNEQRVAEFDLRVAHADRVMAEAEGNLAVAEARKKLDDEIEKGNRIAALKMMGLHEDWDSYNTDAANAAADAAGVWSDTAVEAFYQYQSAQAQALQGELQARLQQIEAEAQLAVITRQNARAQADLLVAQERLIRMSADVAGIGLEEATASAQIAALLAEAGEVQAGMDQNWVGKIGAFIGTSGPWSNEFRGQEAQLQSIFTAIDAVADETGVRISDAQISAAMDDMKWVSATGGDTMSVLRTHFPELVAAETALKVNEALEPVWDIRDQLTEFDRSAEDAAFEDSLFQITQPLKEQISALDFTIAGLDFNASAYQDGNEELRNEYLRTAQAATSAAEGLGASWQVDRENWARELEERPVKHTTVEMDSTRMYTADQVDRMLAKVTAGTNATYSVSTVAAARRGERV